MIFVRIETILLEKYDDYGKNIVDLQQLNDNKIMRFAVKVTLCLCVLSLIIGCVHEQTAEYGIETIDSVTCRYRTTEREGMLRVVAVNDSANEIQHLINESVADRWALNYAVYRFDCGDVTGDGEPEIVVGTVKSTRYRPKKDKRLFIYHLYDGRYIRPLWLGSRVGRPLIDFRVERDSVPNLIHTWEHGEEGDTVQVLYRLKGFGLKFYKYVE